MSKMKDTCLLSVLNEIREMGSHQIDIEGCKFSDFSLISDFLGSSR